MEFLLCRESDKRPVDYRLRRVPPGFPLSGLLCAMHEKTGITAIFQWRVEKPGVIDMGFRDKLRLQPV